MEKKHSGKRLLLLLIFIMVIKVVCAQESDIVVIKRIGDTKFSYNIPPELRNALAGVKYAIIPASNNKELSDYLVRNPNQIDAMVYMDVVDYLQSDFIFQFVGFTPETIKQLNSVVNNPCEVVSIHFAMGEFGNNVAAIGKMEGIQLGFKFCDGTEYLIETEFGVNGLTNYAKKYRKHFSKILNLKNSKYNPEFEKELKPIELYVQVNKLDELINSEIQDIHEGVYTIFTKEGEWSANKIFVKKEDERYVAIFLEGETTAWRKGELKSIFEPTMSKGDYILKHYMADKSIQQGSAIFGENNIEIVLGETKAKYIKTKN